MSYDYLYLNVDMLPLIEIKKRKRPRSKVQTNDCVIYNRQCMQCTMRFKVMLVMYNTTNLALQVKKM